VATEQAAPVRGIWFGLRLPVPRCLRGLCCRPRRRLRHNLLRRPGHRTARILDVPQAANRHPPQGKCTEEHDQRAEPGEVGDLEHSPLGVRRGDRGDVAQLRGRGARRPDYVSSAQELTVRLIFITLLALILATVVGLGATWMTATRGTDLGTLTIGAWTARPKTGTADADPYSRASIARSGELPIGTGDGVAFSATTDDRKRPLDGRCDVVVSGVTPAARFWTLTLYDTKGRLVANSLQRYGFTSQEIIRGSDGAFEVRVASRSRAGNWLPTGGIERYALMLRLYDTPVGVATRTQRDAPMPSITTVGCP